MKQIIDNNLYDTDKATLLYSFLKNIPQERCRFIYY